MTAPVLVLGATGTVGRPLVAELLARGLPVRAASRAARPQPGTTPVRFDYRDAAATAAALDGAGAVFLMLPSGQLAIEAMLAPVVDAAAARGVRIVLQSAAGAEADEEIPYRRVERRIEASGAPFVILRPTWFMDNFATFWRAGIEAGEIALPAGEGRTGFVAAADIAAAAAAALASDRFDGRAFTLTGPEALSYAEAAEILSRVLGRTIRYRAIDDAAFVAGAVAAGIPEPYARFLATLFGPVRAGWTAGLSDGVAALAGRAPMRLEDWARGAFGPRAAA